MKDEGDIILKDGEESIATIKFRTTDKGELPQFYFILRKPEPLENDFECIACYKFGVFFLIEIQWCRYWMKLSKYQDDIFAMDA